MADNNNEFPIQLPLIQWNNFSTVLHDQIRLRMQVQIYADLENLNPEDETFNHQEAWDQLRFNVENLINIHAYNINNPNMNSQPRDYNKNIIDDINQGEVWQYEQPEMEIEIDGSNQESNEEIDEEENFLPENNEENNYNSIDDDESNEEIEYDDSNQESNEKIDEEKNILPENNYNSIDNDESNEEIEYDDSNQESNEEIDKEENFLPENNEENNYNSIDNDERPLVDIGHLGTTISILNVKSDVKSDSSGYSSEEPEQ
ncbi:hypothetical protein PV327_006348 [Microctonus hyperodae]|uniref:Uncharacterized protein n=1 Tax=Microctonus hyperodae TaxID=165561 RepID=A0AA39KIC1_MICHY|nr:hypothetical protein PV327_006348 [Microctonus hyperodae]